MVLVLAQGRVAACVNVVAGVTSTYRWKDSLEESEEVLMIMKTSRSRTSDLVREVERVHPYDVPEIVILDEARAAGPYLEWVTAETEPRR